MNNMRIVECAFDDLDSIMEMAKEEKINPTPGKSKATYFRADCEGLLVGTIKLVELSPRRGRINNLFVLPDWRRQGIGSALIAACVQAGRSYTSIDVYTYQPDIFTRQQFAVVRHAVTSNGDTWYMKRIKSV